MEKQLEEKLNHIMSKPDVVGLVVTDKFGLCLASKGIGSADMSGMLSSVADQARKIDPTGKSPIIRLESDKGYVLVQKKSGFTLAILKKFSNSNSSNYS